MAELVGVLMVLMAAAMIGFGLGENVGQDSIVKDCEMINKFHHDGTVYNCEVVKKESDK